jgi:hypothetical protein
MDPRAITKTQSRLRAAGKAISDLENSKHYTEFSDTWFVFLTAWKSVYTVLEQGSKVMPRSRQWFGNQSAIRRNDPLLQYLYEARNDDEHGLGEVIEHVRGQLNIGVSRPGFSSAVRFDKPIGQGITATSLDNLPVLVEGILPHAKLTRIHGRGRNYDPPTIHLGTPLISNLPIPVAKLGLAYLERMVAEAEGFA